MKNSYIELLGIMQGVSVNNNSPAMAIGIVQQPPPNIVILYNGFQLTKKEVYINPFLLVDYQRTARGHIVSETQPASGGSGEASFSSHTHKIDNDYTDSVITTDTLKVGDHVALMPLPASEDQTTQQYIVLCQLVRLDGK